MEFKDVLRSLRKSEKLTQEELAFAIKKSKSAISMYERGRREPDFETLEAIADYFNVDMSVLLGSSHLNVVSPSITNPNAIRGFPVDEYEKLIILTYRVASKSDRAIIENIVDRYAHNTNE